MFTLNAEGTEYSVTGYNGTATEVVIPATYEKKPVTSIGNNAFEECYNITSIKLPENITNIGDYAFHACSFTSIDISDDITSIGDDAFSGCSSLTTVTFAENNQLTSLVIRHSNIAKNSPP